MPPKKNKRPLDDEAGPSTPAAPAKKQVQAGRWANRPEKSGDAQARLEQEGIKYRDDPANTDEAVIDPQNRTPTELRQQWTDIIAQHLVRGPAFVSAMASGQSPDTFRISKPWQAAIHLPRRYREYSHFKQYYERWFQRNWTEVKQYAIDLYHELYSEHIGVVPTPIENVRVPPADDTEDANNLRLHMFLYHVLRTRMVNCVQAATDQEYILITRLQSEEPDAAKEAIQELDLIDDLKAELRLRISDCATEKVSRELIDDMLASGPQISGNLWDLSQAAVASVTEADKDEEQAPVFRSGIEAEVIAKVNSKHPYAVHFYDPAASGKADVVTINTPKYPVVQMPEHPRINQLGPEEDLDAYDAATAAALRENCDNIDQPRFATNLAHLAAISERPARIKENGIFYNSSARIVLVEDNLLHVKALVAQLRDNELLLKTASDADLQKCMCRIWGLVSIMWGCVVEGSIWLTVMDALLEDLARLLLGQVDPRLNTARMHAYQKLRAANSGQDTSIGSLSDKDLRYIERSDLARRIFAEICRFVRGAVMLWFIGVSAPDRMDDKKVLLALRDVSAPDKGDSKKAGSKKETTKGKKKVTADDAMDIDEAAVPDEEQGAEPEDEMDLDELDYDELEFDDRGNPLAPTKLKPKKSTIDRSDVQSRSKWGLSVGVLDARMGFREERVEISKNRAWAYPCLYDIIKFNKWHPGFGPFWHYFAHLYHTPCQPKRGKDAVRLTIEAATSDSDAFPPGLQAPSTRFAKKKK